MKRFSKKLAVGFIVGAVAVLFGGVSAFAITPEDEAEAKYQAAKEEAMKAQWVKDAAAEDAAIEAVNKAAAAKETAYDNYIVAQAAYFEAKDIEFFKGIYAIEQLKAVPGAKADLGDAKDKLNGAKSNLSNKEKEEAIAYGYAIDARIKNKSDAEINMLEDKLKAAEDATKQAKKDLDAAGDRVAELTKIAEKTQADADAAYAAWKNAEKEMYAKLAVF